MLLAGGYTEEAAGRRLGLSRRTVSRMISTLSAACGATSRFQLGAAAVALGWLAADIMGTAGS